MLCGKRYKNNIFAGRINKNSVCWEQLQFCDGPFWSDSEHVFCSDVCLIKLKW